MRAISSCFSILQAPRCQIHAITNIWRGNLGRNCYSSSFKLEGGYIKKWTRRTVTATTEGKSKTTQRRKLINNENEILDSTVSSRCSIDKTITEKSQFQNLRYYEIQKLSEDKELASLATVIVFDFETTGFSRKSDRIIEIAFQVLSGGENSTFQTLVNPECYVLNSHVHGITSHMVNRPEIPRMKELIPILLQFIRSHQKPGGYTLLVAHNARNFDVPFLIEEFSRCSIEVPSDIRFVDSMTLARDVKKSSGSKDLSGIKLQDLREYYKIPLAGSAHRAMSDVHLLALILQRMTFDLKLPVSGLLEVSFGASDLNKKKKKLVLIHKHNLL